jgi:hypothetical protein
MKNCSNPINFCVVFVHAQNESPWKKVGQRTSSGAKIVVNLIQLNNYCFN